MPDERLKYSSLVTDIGASKLLGAAASGEKVNIKYIALGDGGGQYCEADKTRTELVNECYRTEIKSFKKDPSDNKQLVVKCDIPSEIGDFTLREAGLFDDEGDLIIICSTSDIELVPWTQGQILRLAINIYIRLDEESEGGINIVVKPTEEELLKREILEEVNEHITIWEADGEDIANLLDVEWVEPDESYEEATEEDIRSLFR